MLSPPWPVVLGSGSPRRQQLLKELVAEFEVLVSDVDEDALTVEDPWETAKRLALAKARAVARSRPDALVIGGDTVVAVPLEGGGYEQLAKPSDIEDAKRMLRRLAGRDHLVVTGIALVTPSGDLSNAETTRVFFRPLSDEEIEEYVATGEPMDKAGSYGLQGAAAGFVERFEGSRTNVVGLPLELLEPMLREAAALR